MKITTVKLSDLKKPEKNIRIHTEKQLKEFERSVTMFGQIRPIVIDENNVILAGNGLYDTLLLMGKSTAEVYKYDNLTENQKKTPSLHIPSCREAHTQLLLATSKRGNMGTGKRL